MTLPELLLTMNRPVKNIWRNFDIFREQTKPNRGVFVDTAKLLKDGRWIFFPNDKPWEMKKHLDKAIENDPFLAGDLNRPERIRQILLSATLGAWRPTQDVVRFDDTIYDALLESDMSGNIPLNILAHFPAWSIYFETPYGFANKNSNGEISNWKGFFVTTDGDGDRLSFLFVDDDFDADNRITCQSFFLQLGDETSPPMEKIREAYSDRIDTKGVSTGKDIASEPNLLKAISLLTYVCAHGFEDMPGALSRHVSRPQAKKTKQGWRVFPAPRASLRNLGASIAQRLEKAVAERKAHESRMGGTVRPHLRRAHWHGYWMGPKKDGQIFDVRWLPPILVAAKDEEEISPTLSL